VSATTVQDLETQRDELLKSLRLSTRLKRQDLPATLAHVNMSDLAEMLDRATATGGALETSPDTSEFFSDFIQRSEEGLQQTLEADIAVLARVMETGQDVVEHTAFGMLEGLFPLKVENEIVHCIRTPKLRDRPFSDEECRAIAEVSGADPAVVKEAAADIDILSPQQVIAFLASCRLLRDAFQKIIDARISHAKMHHQLLQSERMRSLGTLSGGVAHHFNNLLSVILGYSSFVLNREDHSKEAADALRKIAEAAQRGRRLTEEILAFAGTEAEEEAPAHVHETLTNVLSLLEAELGSHIRVNKELKAEHDVVISAPSAVHQIVFNLLTNAIDSMPTGGELTLSTSNVRIGSGPDRDQYLKLEVVDSSGALPEGFDQQMVEGEVVHEALAGDRAALKLSNIYGMVGRMEGTMMVSTDPGAMTRVEVLLPTAATEQVEAEPETRRRRRLSPSTIWVVDDDAIFREMCDQVLGDEGHQVEEMSGGKEMQRRWKQSGETPHLIIMDFSMPEFNGLELCEWVRNQGSNVPIILVSGFSAKQSDIKKALRFKRTFFLQKPFTSRDLTDAVTVALGETLIGE